VTPADLGDITHAVIAALPDRTVGSLRRLFAEMRNAGQPFRESSIRMAVDDLMVTGRVVEVPGKRGAQGYQAVVTAARDSSTALPPRPLPATAAPIGGAAGQQSRQDCSPVMGSGGQQSAAVDGISPDDGDHADSVAHRCDVCQEELLAPVSIERGICESCHLTTKRDGKPDNNEEAA
jgi:hypothetical protein